MCELMGLLIVRFLGAGKVQVRILLYETAKAQEAFMSPHVSRHLNDFPLCPFPSAVTIQKSSYQEDLPIFVDYIVLRLLEQQCETTLLPLSRNGGFSRADCICDNVTLITSYSPNSKDM